MDSKSLYDLPKDILVKLITTIQEETKKNLKYAVILYIVNLHGEYDEVRIKGLFYDEDEAYKTLISLMKEKGYKGEIPGKYYFINPDGDPESIFVFVGDREYYNYTISKIEN